MGREGNRRPHTVQATGWLVIPAREDGLWFWSVLCDGELVAEGVSRTRALACMMAAQTFGQLVDSIQEPVNQNEIVSLTQEMKL